jgi:hypothetical protein
MALSVRCSCSSAHGNVVQRHWRSRVQRGARCDLSAEAVNASTTATIAAPDLSSHITHVLGQHVERRCHVHGGLVDWVPTLTVAAQLLGVSDANPGGGNIKGELWGAGWDLRSRAGSAEFSQVSRVARRMTE